MDSVEQILEGLDDAQRHAALSVDGPVRIIAGAGSGKTRTITRRIAYACASRAWNPHQTLAVTFSVKAAEEMKQRLAALGVEHITAATFHSVALHQLIELWPILTSAPMPRILEHQYEIVAQALQQVRGKESDDPLIVRALIQEINWMKVSLIAPEDYLRVCAATGRQTPADLEPTQLVDICTAYEAMKTSRGLMDFNDLLLMICHIGQQFEEGRQLLRQKIRWLTVDEYQDVSPLQHYVMQTWLGKDNTQVCVVGDPAQTIYSFAGATSHYLLDFPHEFPGSTDIQLTMDYRSTPQIVASANRILAASALKDDYLHLVSGNNPGPRVMTTRYETDIEEAQAVARRIADRIAHGQSPEQFAVLMRINAQSAVVAQALHQLGIQTRQRSENISSQDNLLDVSVGARRHEDDNAGEEEKPVAQANQDTLARDGQDSQARPQALGKVTLSTIHAAKGLEWDHVYIIGVSEGLLPFGVQHGIEQIEEERRLLYVALTRAQVSAHISYALHKDAQSMHITRRPSRFLTRR